MQMGLPEAEGLLVQIPTDGGPILQHKVDTPLDELFATFLLLRGLHDVLTPWDAKSRKGYRKRRAA